MESTLDRTAIHVDFLAGYDRLVERYGMTQQEVAEGIGMAQSYLSDVVYNRGKAPSEGNLEALQKLEASLAEEAEGTPEAWAKEFAETAEALMEQGVPQGDIGMALGYDTYTGGSVVTRKFITGTLSVSWPRLQALRRFRERVEAGEWTPYKETEEAKRAAEQRQKKRQAKKQAQEQATPTPPPIETQVVDRAAQPPTAAERNGTPGPKPEAAHKQEARFVLAGRPKNGAGVLAALEDAYELMTMAVVRLKEAQAGAPKIVQPGLKIAIERIEEVRELVAYK